MERYYLQQTDDGAWQITKQDNSSGEWVDTETVKEYQDYQKALDDSVIYNPLFADPTPDWPTELGGEN